MAEQTALAAPRRRVPGEQGTWVFLFGDMVVFAVFFATFLVERGKAPAQFELARTTMHTGIGFTNTLVLLTSSLLVVVAIGAIRADLRATATRALLAAMCCGLVFVGLKVSEYVALIDAGHGTGAGPFYLYYFVLTGLHLLHVCLGLAALGFIMAQTRRATLSPLRMAVVEGAACFWHLVDLLWIVLFPLLYLVS
jgi:nitric oxide reductase NorE protein